MRLPAFCLTALISTPVLAHPGHGVTEGGSVLHYLVEPIHIAPALIIALGLGTAHWLKRRRKKLQHERVRKH